MRALRSWMRFKGDSNRKEKGTLKRRLMRSNSASKSILTWRHRFHWAEEGKSSSLRGPLKSLGSKACRLIPPLKSKWKTIYKTCKSAMKKWKLCINSTLRSWIIIWKFWRKRKNKTTKIINNWRKKNLCWIQSIWILESNMKKKIKSLKNWTNH